MPPDHFWVPDEWRSYLLGQNFTIKTKHKPLILLKTIKNPRVGFPIWHIPEPSDITVNGLSSQTKEDLPSIAIPFGSVSVEEDSIQPVKL